jgi:integrase
MAMMMLLRRMDRGSLTVHGFRSTFRDWAAEATNYPREIAEKALAHSVGDETERSYQRDDLLEKRRRLMEDWAKFCAMPAMPAKVVPIRA